MLRKVIFISLLAILSACNSVKPSSAGPELLPAGPAKGWWHQSVKKQHFDEALTYLDYQASLESPDWTTINGLFYDLRGFSYFADLTSLSADDYQSLSQTLLKLLKHERPTVSEARFVENYAVLVYRLLTQEKQLVDWSEQLTSLVTLFKAIGGAGGIAHDYARWELFRAIGFSAFMARREADLSKLFSEQPELINTLIAEISQSTWRRDHALWSLGYIHQLLPQTQQQQLDERVWSKLQEVNNATTDDKKIWYSSNYLVNSFRGLSECNESQLGRCMSVDMDTVLPIKHQCSARLWIRATSLDEEQLAYSCKRLTSQEQDFHQLFATKMRSVADDYNHALQVVIFDDYSDYNRYGQLLFDIHTDNGGMYIEGTPSDPNNQATFYSFQAFWTADKFKVWNLNHEYVHYLDGRFNKYGGFGHFPEKLVWWSEGLAELIAKGNENPKAIKVLQETQQQQWPSLQNIFATEYGQSTEQIYQWSYLAIRYLSQHDLAGLRALQRSLRDDSYTGYNDKLAELAEQHEDTFKAFLATLVSAEPQPQRNQRATVNKEYRYLYRSYLQPPHLQLTGQHQHYF
ncbi:collagenase [Pseudoalteromonas sp. T1lg23B]|uniref:collagenase n=1 Tax=Pseudoalteromonas sp. T1lg23B TaxID=2077097 RepID=UPI000CF73808|nr:collagenase [Pseudoalteromonas sp. T1lg23B]